MGECDRGLEREADHVRKIAVALEAAGQLRAGTIGLRVDEHQDAELFDLGPERVKLGIGELLAIDAGPDGGAAQAVLLDAVFQLFGREIGELQCDGGEGDKAGGMGGDRFGELFVLQLNDFLGEVAVGLAPERVDRQCLHVDALRIHRSEALIDRGHHGKVRAQRRCRADLQAHQGHRFGY